MLLRLLLLWNHKLDVMLLLLLLQNCKDGMLCCWMKWEAWDVLATTAWIHWIGSFNFSQSWYFCKDLIRTTKLSRSGLDENWGYKCLQCANVQMCWLVLVLHALVLDFFLCCSWSLIDSSLLFFLLSLIIIIIFTSSQYT